MPTLKYKNGSSWTAFSVGGDPFPIGSCYIQFINNGWQNDNYSAFTPASLYGGTWSQVDSSDNFSNFGYLLGSDRTDNKRSTTSQIMSPAGTGYAYLIQSRFWRRTA